MKKGIHFIQAVCGVFVVMVVTVMISGTQVYGKQTTNYKALIEETGTYLNDALNLYKQGKIDQAKLKAQGAYFEVYENLEGPIRVNISAKKNIEMEEEFVGIRKMIVAKAPAAAIEKRINDFMVNLRALAPELEGGVELVADAGKSEPNQNKPATVQAAGNIEPAWQQALATIQSGLNNALEQYKKGDAKIATSQVIQTQYDGYKNSLLETAVRRHISQKKDFEYNSGFSDISGLMQKGVSPADVDKRISSLIAELQADLPGLPLIDGAASAKEVEKTAGNDTAGKDWSKVTAELYEGIEKAIALYSQGSVKEAIIKIQDTYFDVFEGSGMESKIGARDVNFKSTLESHFSKMVGQMKNGADAAALQADLAAMKSDFSKAVDMLGKGQDSPFTLFVYSLMIILREGFEAILIITAIIAYLVKTGNSDKLKTIYNGCFAALALSVVTAILVKWVFKTSAANQELLEGGTMLLASVVLFSVSYWLISKAEARKWGDYLKNKVGQSLSSNSLKALWFTAFLAVYREGAETVLFYQALTADANGTSGIIAIAAGFGIGCVLLAAIYMGMRYGALKLAIRPFFLFTGALMYYMSFVFVGKGVMELIEGKLFEPSLVTWVPTLPFIGIYPYLQTLLPQSAIILTALAGLYLMSKQNRQQTVKSNQQI
jgi:high-affinity iron transporter